MRLGAAKAVKEQALSQWEIDHAWMIQEVNRASVEVTEVETKLREMTLQVYAETGNKVPAPGVAVREITRLEYDPQVAFLWAQDHHMALKLDASAFEKIAKASPLDFVKMRGEAQATIATDLSKILEVKEVK